MARPKNPSLPPITSEMVEASPDDFVEIGARGRGAWAWRCSHKSKRSKQRCGMPASSVSANGMYCCARYHGGVKVAQADANFKAELEAKGVKVGRPSGRPRAAHSLYATTVETVDVEALVAKWRAEGIDPDDTDEDILRQRAYLARLTQLDEPIQAILELLYPLKEMLADLPSTLVDLGGSDRVPVPLSRLVEVSEEVAELKDTVTALLKLMASFLSFQSQLEYRHTELIKNVKIRAETKLKNAQKEQIKTFFDLLERFNVLLEDMMPPEVYQAYLKRMNRDMSDLPWYELGHKALVLESKS